MRQGVISDDGCTLNCIKLRINSKNKNASIPQDAAIANAYWNEFIVPLHFKMVDSVMPYYQSGLGDQPCYKIAFNDYGKVIELTEASPDANYKISDISLEYEIVTQPDLARRVSDEYQNMALLYDRVLRNGQIPGNKSDTTWNWSFNTPCKSLKGILVLFDKEQSYTRGTSKFYNPKVKEVYVIIEGKPNQLYAQGMRRFEQ